MVCKNLWNIALSIALSCVANLMLNLYLSFADATMEQILSETSLRALFVVSTNVGMLLTVFILTRLGRQRIDALSLSALVVFLAILVMELVVVELLYTLRAHFQLDDASFIREERHAHLLIHLPVISQRGRHGCSVLVLCAVLL